MSISLRNFLRHARLLIEQGVYESRNLSHVGQSRALELTRLEERVLFSASAIAPVVAEIAEAGGDLMTAAATADQSMNNSAFSIADQQFLDQLADSVLPSRTADQHSIASDPAQHTLELVFLDSSINNIERMKADLQASSASDSSRTLEFVVLDSTKDGIAQITSAMLQYNGIDGIHIVSQGDAGEVQLGSTTLSLDNLYCYRTAIAAWQYSMSDKADLLIYGCNLAASADGQQLMSDLSTLTGTQVSASEDLIGTPILDGPLAVIAVSNNVLHSSETLNIPVTPVNGNAPIITSNGSGATASISVFENTTAITTVLATDADLPSQTLTYSIVGGADAASFSINSSTGILAFVSACDFENPTDVGGNNVYDVIVRASDGSLYDDQAIAVTVIDVSNFLVVTTVIDNNDSGILAGASYNIEWLNAHKGADGLISLREAIIAANNTAGVDTVNFNIAGTGVHTIRLLSALPSITDTIVLNAYSQAGASVNTSTTGTNAVLQIALDGSGAGGSTSGLTLAAGSGGSTIRGLAISRFGSAGINLVNSGNNTIAGNFVGTNAGGSAALANGFGVYISSGANNTIGGLTPDAKNIISGNTNYGLYVSSSSNVVEGNLIGLNAGGTAAVANYFGMFVDAASNTRIGGTTAVSRNIVSGNTLDGIWIGNATGTIVEGNYVGTNAAGTGAVANARHGILVQGTNTLVGGTAAGSGNLVSGNAIYGVYILANNNTVQSNIIGLDVTGTTKLSNQFGGVMVNNSVNTLIGGTTTAARNIISGNFNDGVRVNGTSTSTTISGNYIGTDITGTLALSNARYGVLLNVGTVATTVGGITAGSANLISGNQGYGVYVRSDNNTISGNIIGLNAAGDSSIANDSGIYIDAAANNVIGGTTAFARNVISGNINDGVVIAGASSTSNVVEGNYLGTNAAGTLAIANTRYGVLITLNATGNMIGGTAAEARNIITGSGRTGVAITSTATGNAVLRNSIYGNTGLGIDLGDDGVTTNNGTMNGSVAGQGMDSPVFTIANLVSNTLTVSGYIGSVPNQTAFAGSRVEIYLAAVDSSNYGEGQTFLGFLTADANGNFSGSLDVTGQSMTFASVLTATATSTANNTSEFGANHSINVAPVAVSDTAIAVEAGGTLNGTPGSNPSGNVLTNDTDANGADTQTVTGVAAGTVASASTDVGSSVFGSYGAITIAANGAYVYTIDNNNVAVQALRTNNETLTDVFTYTMHDSGGVDSTTQITITIQGANDAPDNITTGALAIDENAANGSAVGNAAGSDVDSGDTLTYSLVDSAGGRFTIDSSSGAITVANGSLLNYEAASSHGITIRVTDAGGLTCDKNFTVFLNDVNEFAVGPVADTNASANSVAEDATVGTLVGITAFASDADATTNTIMYSLDDAAGGRFAIDSVTGVVTLAGALDYETATSHSIIVRASSADGSISTQTFTITIGDVNEFAVGSVTDTNVAANTVAEDAVIGTTVGITAFASDADATTNAIAYTLDDTAGGRFAINSVTGVVTVAGALDYESATSHSITVRATSADGSFSTQLFTINVTDVDEFDVTNPTDVDATANAVDENAAIGTAVGITASASDADATTNTVTYSLFDNDGGNFAIDANTGVVANAVILNREALGGSRNITVRATSVDGSTADTVFTISINDIDEFDVSNPTDVNATANAVDENATNGTLVGITASASDADATTNAINYSLFDNAGGRFAIDSTTGVVTVADGTLLDREVAASHNITVRATSADGSTADTSFTINVNDINEFAVGPVSDTNASANSIAEDATIGTTVGITAFASDADATTNTVTYTLDNNAGGRFAINGVTGVVTVADALDYETATSHNITVRATSTDGSFSTQLFTINVTDVNEFGVTTPVDNNPASNSVNENAANGTVVGVAAYAFDADGSNNTVSYTLVDNAGGRFAINSVTGVVTVADGTLLDRETAASYNITVRVASADRSTANAVFTININDINEFAVGTVSNTNASANSVAEDATIGTVVGITAFASDADATTNAIAYTLDDTAGGRFAINSVTGVVTMAGALDYETATSHNITVRATSTDGSFSTQLFTINVTDVNEFGVTTPADNNPASNSVNENAANGTVVGVTAYAFDADGTTNIVTYSLDDNATGRFTIHAATGVVTVLDGSLLDRETAASHNIVVRATSVDGSSATRMFTININDVNEFAVGPVIDTNAAANTVAENATIGTTVGITALASDADATTNAIIYTLDNNAGGRFAINSVTGVVTVASALDYESASSYNITVRATSTDTSTVTRVFTITIGDVNEFAAGPVTDSNAAANTVAENATIGTTVGITALASDADATTNAITYTLDNNAGGRLAIDNVTGVVTVAGALDYEMATSHSIIVRATSADGSFSTQLFTINVSDVNEFGVTIPVDNNPAANNVNVNAANGTAVGVRAYAFDADGTRNIVTYSLDDNAGGRFTIHAATGVVTVLDGSLLDRVAAASHNITVRATSADGSYATGVFTINISDINENRAPVAHADYLMDLQLTELPISPSVLLANDFDPDGDALTVVIVSGPTHGTLIRNTNGSWTYMPTGVYSGTDTFHYLVTDGQFFSVPVVVTIDIQQTIGGGNSGGGNGGGTGSNGGSGSSSTTGSNSSDGGSTGSGSGGTSTGNSSHSVGLSTSPESGSQSGLPSGGGLYNSSGILTHVTTEEAFEGSDDSPLPAAADFSFVGTPLISTLAATVDVSEVGKTAANRLQSDTARAYVRNVASLWDGLSVAIAPEDAIVPHNFFTINQSERSDQQQKHDMATEVMDKVFVGSTAVVSTSLSVGYVIWILRGGSLLTVFVSAMPAWQSFDPLPILQSFDKDDPEDDESLLTLVTRKAAQGKKK